MKIISVALSCILCFLSVSQIAAQECKTLRTSAPAVVTSYLEGAITNGEDADCITLAIKILAERRYEPAISVLAGLLDFRRPPNAHEKAHVVLHPPSVDEMYPAAAALEEIGKKSLPALMDVIKSDSASAKAIENSVAVWMEIYKDDEPQGVAVLGREAAATDDSLLRQKFNFAVAKAQALCTDRNKARCKAAAERTEP